MVTRAVRAPRRSSNALVATVEPWAKTPTLSASRSAAVTARSTPRAWSDGVDGVFAVTRAPSTSATRSVNVPPTSTPSLARSMIHLPLAERYSTTAADQSGGRWPTWAAATRLGTGHPPHLDDQTRILLAE